jgi:hypothetical protein
MQLSSTLSWLVDAAGEAPGADRLLAEVGARLVADGIPLAGGAVGTEKLNPRVVMVKSAQDGVRTYETGSLNRPRIRRIFV